MSARADSQRQSGLKETGGSLRSLLGSLSAAALEGNPVTLALETLGSNQTLDLGGLGVVGLALTGDGTTDDELADVVLLVETEEAADLGGTLGTESLGDNGVGETGELTLTLLDDAQGKDGEVEVGDGCNDKCQLRVSFSLAVSVCRTVRDIPPRTLLRFLSPVRRGR